VPFPLKVRTRVLLWCDRRCCLCKKSCGPYIHVHHIVPEGGKTKGKNTEDNAIPVCFDCHGVVGNYNDDHPIGSKLQPSELIARRDQVYEEFTRHLVPPIRVRLNQAVRDNVLQWPQVGFHIAHLGNSLPVKVRVKVESVFSRRRFVSMADEKFNGKVAWNMNPGFSYSGDFTLPPNTRTPNQNRRPQHLRITLTVIDAYKRSHELLPELWVYDHNQHFWWLQQWP